ncbi:vitamin K-dependent gamma-carboxylase-like protein [Aquimarina sp. MAR_2010_214]|uniref:HTTM domain-containing protein n=1 Tax=Aquimarina sp. MAR_2010_214 TaxID=1250026 RepID=UPI000C70D2CD|nr:HTTM domain-containing protein [Aquimarina sp. MAR_2010_214]PKV49206.1 vitamin K-dependent gamma-carboxylase-like protein [Aquimarina sp. MAR_2010_214]
MINRWLFTHIDNSSLIIFRVFFGFLIAAEAIGAIFTGWVTRTLVEPKFTFNFIGLDFLQPLPGNGMYYYFAVMGIFGLLVMIGFKYRWSMISYTILWAGVYFMQKASYNNHYYLLLLLCILMCTLPAGNYFSVDVKRNPLLKKIAMPRWCVLVIIAQLWIVYTYASVAKLYPDWLDFTVAKNLMAGKANYPIVGEILQERWAHVFIAYYGILFDLLIVPLLLWKRTRLAAFCFSVFFHIFNSIVFQIGIFPYLSLAFTVFFFSRERIHHLFMKKKEFYNEGEIIIPSYRKFLIPVITLWFIIQILLPIRHWTIPGDVLWTEEGHRMSWRMMLRGRYGTTNFYVVDKNDPKALQKLINKNDYLSKKQLRLVSSKPDAMWQFAQRLKTEYATKEKDIAIYVHSKVSINGKKYQTLIDPKVDLANASWNYFTTNPWILKYEEKE